MARTAEREAMGIMEVEVEILKTQGGAWRRIRLLVDTGASLSFIPKTILEELGIQPVDVEPFELADGRIVERRVGPAVVRYQGKEAGTQVVFAEPGDSPLLGVNALEELGLQLNPRSGRLEKARRLAVAVHQV
ncbi:MAG TPA: clan AA aspartic protease [Thermoplasmata archaeon]|jgi:clan AA aspartic protease|nr:clan AA aspartic protease [Thermoplasmata archaeon]